jgi:hypothetical protein
MSGGPHLYCIHTGHKADRWGVCPVHQGADCLVRAHRRVIEKPPLMQRVRRWLAEKLS